MHPILDALTGTEHETVKNLLFAFNAGDIAKFETLVPSLSDEVCHSLNSSVPSLSLTLLPVDPQILQTNYAFLRQKICLMALIEAVFRRPTSDRVIPFSVIASDARVPIDEVEHLVMKALSFVLPSSLPFPFPR